jgi:signal transduction histidine kinase
MGGNDRDRPHAPGPAPERPALAAHARPRFWSSVRLRLLIPVLLAAVAVGLLGALQIAAALAQAGRADRSSSLATATGAIGAVAHEIGGEYVANNDARRSGSTNALSEQVRRTDAAIARYEAVVPRLLEAAPDLARLTGGVRSALDLLPAARIVAAQNQEGSAEVTAFYEQCLTALSSLADALPPHLEDQVLIQLARSVTLATGLDRLAAFQLDLVSRALARGRLLPSEQIALAQWAGGERTLVEALSNAGLGGESYATVRRSTTSTTAGSIRQVLLDDRAGDAVLGVDPKVWSTAQTGRLAELWTMEQALAAQLDHEAAALGVAARERAYLFAGLSVAIVAATLGGAIATVVRVTRRLRQTRYAALTAARIELPTAIANVTTARDAGTVRAALADSSARVDTLLHSGPDEIGELATAFGAVHRQALRLAADQALTRMEVQAMFIALSRRGQTLVQRQIHLIDEFGRDETEPEALARLFALDHLAARMRRNEENLLVLAGGEPARWITRPVAIQDLVRASAQEIEEYRRIEVREVPDHAIGANVAGDTIHLLAELLENATSYSPPSSVVRVDARRTVEGLVISVRDDGIGMPADRLAEANDRLERPSALTSTLVGTMGLLVVARLAQRHGIAVRLESTVATGTTASVTLPDRLLMPLTPEDRLYAGRWLREPREFDATMLLPPAVIPAPAANTLPSLTIPAAPALPAIPPPARPAPALPSPARPAPALPSPAVPPPGPATLPAAGPPAGVTRTGLPRRPTSDRPPEQDEAPTPPSTPDPDAVRARLSSLASGIAAANQDQSRSRTTP